MDNPLLRPDPGLFIWTIVTFLVLLALLAKFAWRPLLNALESRQESIRRSLDDAQKAKQELERLHAESAENGIAFTDPPRELPGAQIARIRDGDGIEISLSS